MLQTKEEKNSLALRQARNIGAAAFVLPPGGYVFIRVCVCVFVCQHDNLKNINVLIQKFIELMDVARLANQETLFPSHVSQRWAETRKHCFLVMFSKGGQTRKHCFLVMFSKGRQTRKHCFLYYSHVSQRWAETRKHCFLVMFSKGGQTRKQCFLVMFSKGGQTRKH